MGYGPAAKRRFGWAYCNEHGNGTRMTPYFKTEKGVEAFHDWIQKNYNRYKHKSLMYTNPVYRMLGMMDRDSIDLRTFKLPDVNQMALDYEKEIGKSVCTIKVKGDTMHEFYGCDLSSTVENKTIKKGETMREFYGHELFSIVGYSDEEEEEEEEKKEEKKRKRTTNPTTQSGVTTRSSKKSFKEVE